MRPLIKFIILVREFYQRSGKSGNIFLTKKFLHQSAYKDVS